MTAQILQTTLTGYRIGDNAGAFPIYSAEGSRVAPGRWNVAIGPVIYVAEHYSTAMLEKLVYSNGIMPRNAHYIDVTLPVGVSYETFSEAACPDWYKENKVASRRYGVQWRKEKRSLILIVPSVIARMESNFIINPDHPEAVKITHSAVNRPVWWDRRLFGPTAAS